MTRRVPSAPRALGLLTLGLVALALWTAPLGTASIAEAGIVQISIHQPPPFQAVFGEVMVEVEADAEAGVASAVLYLDDRRVGMAEAPPFRWKVDVGQENVEHRFRVEIRDRDGAVAEATRITPAVKINESVDIELQQLYVTVTRGDQRVLDLDEDAFRVLDNGKRQELVTFARGDVPLAAALLIDSSLSMEGERLDAAVAGARAFASGMKELDEASLMLFSDRLLRATAFSNDRAPLLETLAAARADGDTAVNDHLYLALARLDARQGRRVVILFTDGADLNSVLDMRDVLWKARRSQALIYWIRLEGREKGAEGAEFSTAWRNSDNNRRQYEMLEEAVELSGGRIAALERLDEIEPAFRGILEELREQYVLGFYPVSRNDGAWHEVDVKVERGGVKVRARDGYVDF